MDIKTLDFKTEIKAHEEDNKRTFEAYASTFGNIDNHMDIIVRGAFVESLKKRKPKLAYQHDYTRLVGVITDAWEDEIGLKVKGDFLDTELGEQVYKEVKAGAIDSMSIGYATNEAEYDDTGIRRIKSLELYEVSFVTFPANEKAIVTGIKANDIKTIRDFEEHLRDVGISNLKAKLIAINGFKEVQNDSRDGSEVELKNSIENLINKFRGNSNVD